MIATPKRGIPRKYGILVLAFIVCVGVVVEVFVANEKGSPEAKVIESELRQSAAIRKTYGEIEDLDQTRGSTKVYRGTDGAGGTYGFDVRGKTNSGSIVVRWNQKQGGRLIIEEIRKSNMEGAEILWSSKQ